MLTSSSEVGRTGRWVRCWVVAVQKQPSSFGDTCLSGRLMSAVTGLLVWAFAWLAGLPLAVEWGVIAFALNFIPFIGPFIATVFPTVFAIAQFELVADGTARFRVSQRHPIRGGKLSGATVRRQRNVDFALCRFVRGFFLDFSLGSGRGVHWHSDCHRSSHALRGASLDSLDCRPFRLASA